MKTFMKVSDRLGAQVKTPNLSVVQVSARWASNTANISRSVERHSKRPHLLV